LHAGPVIFRTAALTLACLAACEPSYPRDAHYPLNALRWLGTHNSYHLAMPDAPRSLAYTHAPILEQLEAQRVRQFELDVYFDGGRFLVMHIPFFDDRSTCKTLDACLTIFADWSKTRPTHAPVIIMIELKDVGARTAHEPFFTVLDETVQKTLGESRLITPPSVQRDSPTLADALQTYGWPTLTETRGKFLVFLLADQPFTDSYAKNGLTDRPLFVRSGPGLPYSAIASVDTPTHPAVAASVAANMIVRTRPDAHEPTLAQRSARAEQALASDAHILSTDHPVDYGDGYRLPWPRGVVVACHPSLAPAGCDPREIEAP
jgi:hypothetical protein